MIEIPLTQGKIALIDDDDYMIVSQYKWYAHRLKMGGWYAHTSLYLGGGRVHSKRRTLSMHRLVVGDAVSLVDHKNGDTLDNRRSNLRACTPSQNKMNAQRHRNASSRYKGVHYLRSRDRWVARITVNGKRRSVGVFLGEELAARAYDRAARENFREFAKLNFPAEI